MTLRRNKHSHPVRRLVSLTIALLMVCSLSLPSVALAADLNDSSAESSVVELSQQDSDSSADASTSVEVDSSNDTPSTEGEASSQGVEDEVAASLDDDVGDASANPAASAITEPVLRMGGAALRGAADGSEEAEADPDIDPYADDGAGEGGQTEDVAETETETLTVQAAGNDDAVPTVNLNSEMAGVQVSYAADATSSFNSGSLSPGQVWVDKSVSKTSTTETSFNETLSIYANKFTTESEYSTGNYVLVLDTTRSLYNADHSGKLVKAVTKATNDIIVEICKNPLSNVAVVGFSADNRERTLNKNADATTVILGMGNWKKAGKSLLKCDTSDSNECKWYIGATDAAKNSKVASTSKRYISYGTFTQAGVAHAASILKAQSDKSETAGYMLILTDGVPTYGTTKWAANYDTSNAAWQSKSSASIGNGGGADSKAAAYTLMTMQYWNKVLKDQYAEFKMLTAHFSNDDYDSSEEAMAKWCVGVVNNVTYSAGTGSTKNDKGYVGSVISSGWPKNRLSSTYTGSSKADLKSAAKTLKNLMTDANVTKLGLNSATDFPAPALAQFANLSNQSSVANKTAALEHVFDNLQNMIHKDKTTQGGLKSGTVVTFTTKTGNYMVVSGDPVLYYSNQAYSGVRAGNIWTYSIAGQRCTVMVNTSGNRSTVTATIPSDLVNRNGMEGNAHPIRVSFNTDLFSTNYQTVYQTTGGDFTTYTNEFSSEQSKVTYTTASDNPWFATTGTETANKKANTTGTLGYVTQLTKAKSGRTSSALLGNNGKLSMSFNWGTIDVSVWEINQADQTKILPGVAWYVADSNGRKVVLNGTELSFSSGNDPQVIEGLPAGEYRLVTSNVPAGHVIPDYTAITVQKQTERQHFDIYVPTILIDVWAIDKATEEKVEGVTASILDASGRTVYQDVPLEFIQEYVPAGDYTIRITAVPDRYQYPEDTPITVRAIREKQDYIIPLEHLGSITIKKTDDHGDPVQGASYDLADSTGRVMITRTTDRNGVAVFSDRDKLVVGEYVITETKTGAGLTLLSDSIRATIPLTMSDAEAQAKGADTSKGWHNARTGTWYFYDLTFNITNTAKFTMPMSGDIPTVLRLCMVSGMTGLLAGTAYLVFRRRTASAASAN